MPFNYNKLWTLIKSKGMSRSDLRDKIKASQATIVKMGKNENVSLDVLDRICNELNCQPEDIYEFIPNSQPEVKTKYKCGELYYADLGQSSMGTEPGGTRPVLIIQNDIANNYPSSIIIAPLSSNTNKMRLPTHFEIKVNKKNNLQKDGLIILEQIRAIDKRRLQGKIGEITFDELEQIKKSLLFVFGI